MSADVNFYIQAIIAVVVITDPITRGIYFRILTEHEPERRGEYIRRITITVAIVLFVSALIGRELLEAIGINLGAFGVAGGFVVALMGAEMLFGGEPSRAQGGKAAHEERESFEGSVVVPYAIPFVAGPGAITTVITISAATDDTACLFADSLSCYPPGGRSRLPVSPVRVTMVARAGLRRSSALPALGSCSTTTMNRCGTKPSSNTSGRSSLPPVPGM